MAKCINLDGNSTPSIPHTEDQQQLLVRNLCQIHGLHIDEDVAEKRSALLQRETAKLERILETLSDYGFVRIITVALGTVSADQREEWLVIQIPGVSCVHQLSESFLQRYQHLFDDLRCRVIETEENRNRVVEGEKQDDVRLGKGSHACDQITSFFQGMRTILLEELLVLVQEVRVVQEEAGGERWIQVQIVASHQPIVLFTVIDDVVLGVCRLSRGPVLLQTALRVLLHQLSMGGFRTSPDVVNQFCDAVAPNSTYSRDVGRTVRPVALCNHCKEEVISVDSVLGEKAISLIHQKAVNICRFFVNRGKELVPGFAYSSRSQSTEMTPGTGRTK